MLKNIGVILICSRCNKLDVCNVPVHSDVLPSVCPDTPKYLEAQFECVSHIKIAEENRQSRFPRFGGNISDLWSDRNIILNVDLVKDALETVIFNQHIPITEEPAILLVSSEIRETNDESTEVSMTNVTSVNSLRYIFSNQKENTTSLPRSLRNSSLSDNNCMNKERWQWTSKEVLIIILISLLSVIFIILAAAIIIIKVES